MCVLLLAEETDFLLMEKDKKPGGRYMGAARGADGPVHNLLMPCLTRVFSLLLLLGNYHRL